MDTIALTTIASTVVSLLVSYLKIVGENLAKKAGEQIGSKLGETAWVKAKQLFEIVKMRFTSNSDTAKVINALEKSPNDNETQLAVQFHLKQMLETDKDFAKKLAGLLKEISEVGADTIFQTNISGNVQKLVQMGDVYGNINF